MKIQCNASQTNLLCSGFRPDFQFSFLLLQMAAAEQTKIGRNGSSLSPSLFSRLYRGDQMNLKSSRALKNTLRSFSGFLKLYFFPKNVSFFDAISFQTRPPWREGLSSTGAPYPTAPVERIQFSPNVVVTKEIRSKIGHFPLCVSFWLPLYRSNREKSLPREHFPASPLARSRRKGRSSHGVN